MNNVLETLFYPYKTGVLKWPEKRQKVLFLNAEFHENLNRLDQGVLLCVQPFKPYTDFLSQFCFTSKPSYDFNDIDFDFALVLIPKNRTEAQFLVALAQSKLKPGGQLVCAANNKAGGARLKKMLQVLKFEKVQDLSKNKARAAWGSSGPTNEKTMEWIKSGGLQKKNNFYTRPGLFGWEKIDRGSALLLSHLSGDLNGVGADFGCGYGYLSRTVLERKNVKKLYCIDADYRALECLQKNINDSRAEFIWADLTQKNSGPENLDFIVMNPPFHEGKTETTEAGKAFIVSASQALRPGGVLFMVANTHLPYESVLYENFSNVQKLAEREGYKVFKAMF